MTPRLTRRQAAAAAALAVLLILFFLVTQPAGFARAVDFQSFWYGARYVLEQGQPPYDAYEIFVFSGKPLFPYFYPPPSLLIYAPFGMLPDTLSFSAYTWLNRALYLGAVGLMIWLITGCEGARRRPWVVAALAAFAVLSSPLSMQFFLGQANVILLAFLAGWWACERANRPVAAGFFLACAASLKVYPALLILLLGAGKRWKSVGSFFVSGLVLLTVTALLFGPSFWTEWVRRAVLSVGYVSPHAIIPPPGEIYNQSLNGFVARTFTAFHTGEARADQPLLGRIVLLVLAGGAMAASLLALFRCAKEPGAAAAQEIAVLGLPLIFLCAPFSWEHHIVFVLPALLIVLARVLTASGERLPLRALVLCALLVLHVPMAHMWLLPAMVIVWTYALWSVWRGSLSSDSPALVPSA